MTLSSVFPLPVEFLSKVFLVGGALMGLPSVAVLMAYGVMRLQMWMQRPASSGGPVSNPDAILMILGGMTRLAGFLAGMVSEIARVALTGLSIVASVGLVFAVVLWFTGKGLQHGAGWARITGSGVSILLLVIFGLIMLSTGGMIRIAALLGVGVCVAVLHSLSTYSLLS